MQISTSLLARQAISLKLGHFKMLNWLVTLVCGGAVQDRNFQDNAEFFQDCFEAGRRFKIMNPDKMRAEYGKLVYMLMDSADDHIQNLLEFRSVRPLRTVHALLAGCSGLAVLDDPLVEVATAEIVTGQARCDQ